MSAFGIFVRSFEDGVINELYWKFVTLGKGTKYRALSLASVARSMARSSDGSDYQHQHSSQRVSFSQAR